MLLDQRGESSELPKDSSTFSYSIKEALKLPEKPTNDLDEVSAVLSKPLQLLGIASESNSPSPVSLRDIHRFIPLFQATILTKLAPTWLHALESHGDPSLLTWYLCPPESPWG